MADYLPDIYVSFRERFPQVAQAQDRLAAEVDTAGPLDVGRHSVEPEQM